METLLTLSLLLAFKVAAGVNDEFIQMPKCPGGQSVKTDVSGSAVICLPNGQKNSADCGQDHRCWFNGFNYFCCPFDKAAKPILEEGKEIIPGNVGHKFREKAAVLPIGPSQNELEAICPNKKRPHSDEEGFLTVCLPASSGCPHGLYCWFSGLNYVCCPTDEEQVEQKPHETERLLDKDVVVNRPVEQEAAVEKEPRSSPWLFGGHHHQHQQQQQPSSTNYNHPQVQPQPQSSLPYQQPQPAPYQPKPAPYESQPPPPTSHYVAAAAQSPYSSNGNRAEKHIIDGASFPISFRPMGRARTVTSDEKIIKLVYIPAPAAYNPKHGHHHGASYRVMKQTFQPSSHYNQQRSPYQPPSYGQHQHVTTTRPTYSLQQSRKAPYRPASRGKVYNSPTSRPSYNQQQQERTTTTRRPVYPPATSHHHRRPSYTRTTTTRGATAGGSNYGRVPTASHGYPQHEKQDSQSEFDTLLRHVQNGYPYNDRYYFPSNRDNSGGGGYSTVASVAATTQDPNFVHITYAPQRRNVKYNYNYSRWQMRNMRWN